MSADVSGSPVLLLHGSGPGTTAAAWRPLAAALAPRHRVIAPDLLGFGGSPRPEGSLRAAWTRQEESRLSFNAPLYHEAPRRTLALDSLFQLSMHHCQTSEHHW